MSQFRGNATNRLDSKGRVSVPANFRPMLGGPAFVLRRSTRHPCLEGWPGAAFDTATRPTNPLEDIAPEDDLLSYAMVTDTVDVAFDPEGRIVIPKDYRDFAGITEGVTFFGRPGFVELWEPKAAEALLARARAAYEARQRGPAASGGPSSGPSGGPSSGPGSGPSSGPSSGDTAGGAA